MARADRPNSTTRKRYAMALRDAPCMTCGGYVDWETVGKPDSATFGHRLGDSVGGKWSPDNIGAQCWTCNNGLKEMADLRGKGDQYFTPYTLPSQSDADAWHAGKYAHLDRVRIHRQAIVSDILARG